MQPLADIIGDGLDLTGIRAGAQDEIIGEGRNLAQVKHANVFGLLGFSGSNRGEPERIT